jgi:hypothetical protein
VALRLRNGKLGPKGPGFGMLGNPGGVSSPVWNAGLEEDENGLISTSVLVL